MVKYKLYTKTIQGKFKPYNKLFKTKTKAKNYAKYYHFKPKQIKIKKI